MKKTILALTVCLLAIAAARGQRLSVSLDRGWSYTPGWETDLSAPGQPVNLPHTWNADALGGKPDYYRGLGGYLKAVEIP